MKGDGCVYMSLARFGSRNKRMLDKEIERGIGKGMDPMRLADELYQRAESRKVCFALLQLGQSALHLAYMNACRNQFTRM